MKKLKDSIDKPYFILYNLVSLLKKRGDTYADLLVAFPAGIPEGLRLRKRSRAGEVGERGCKRNEEVRGGKKLSCSFQALFAANRIVVKGFSTVRKGGEK